jgi:hypothetical protein
MTVVDGRVVSPTPIFFGSNPSETTLVGATLRLLGPEEDLARSPLHSFDDQQRDAAVISAVPPFELTQVALAEVEEGAFHHARLNYGYDVSEDELARLEAFTAQCMDRLGWSTAHADAVRCSHVPRGIGVSRMTAMQREILTRLSSNTLSACRAQSRRRKWPSWPAKRSKSFTSPGPVVPTVISITTTGSRVSASFWSMPTESLTR